MQLWTLCGTHCDTEVLVPVWTAWCYSENSRICSVKKQVNRDSGSQFFSFSKGSNNSKDLKVTTRSQRHPDFTFLKVLFILNFISCPETFSSMACKMTRHCDLFFFIKTPFILTPYWNFLLPENTVCPVFLFNLGCFLNHMLHTTGPGDGGDIFLALC
jgi:hypothetical protein